jgi:hypothetical protein
MAQLGSFVDDSSCTRRAQLQFAKERVAKFKIPFADNGVEG